MSESPEQFESRKRDHIEIALKPENQAGATGLDQIILEHEALPDIDFKDIRLESEILNQKVCPLFISSMTAGHGEAVMINSRLALACQNRNWFMGVGSQRRQLTDKSIDSEWKAVRKIAPKVVLMGNLGISQLIETPMDDVNRLVDSLEATALIVHLNSLQETLQPEGTPNFKGSFAALENLCKNSKVPVIVKETGCGFSKKTLRKLMNIGAYAVDISGFGGTHWGRIEGQRAAKNSVQSVAAETFKNWGISTVQSLLNAIELNLDQRTSYEIWASGGVRTGLDAAKLLVMGAQAVGFAKPALEEALKGSEQLWNWMETREFELKTAMFCTGKLHPTDLKTVRYSHTIL